MHVHSKLYVSAFLSNSFVLNANTLLFKYYQRVSNIQNKEQKACTCKCFFYFCLAVAALPLPNTITVISATDHITRATIKARTTRARCNFLCTCLTPPALVTNTHIAVFCIITCTGIVTARVVETVWGLVTMSASPEILADTFVPAQCVVARADIAAWVLITV